MADKKISALTAASTPLAGTEVLPIVQSSATVKVSVANLTAGRSVSATAYSATSGGFTSSSGGVHRSDSAAESNSISNLFYAQNAAGTKALNWQLSSTNVGSVWAYNGSSWIEVWAADTSGNLRVPTQNVIMGTADKGVLDSTSTVSIKFKSTAAYLSGGDFYINTSTALSSTAKLQISNGTGRAIATAGSSGDVGTESLRIGKFDNDSTTSQLFVRFTINNDGAGSGQINANGASAAAFGTYSDERLKENIVNLPSQLSNICALRPVEFDYKDGSGHQIGFIAQEMQQIYPDVVSPGDEGMLTVTGWSKTEARLVKAIQEQQSLIEALTTKLTALEQKVG